MYAFHIHACASVKSHMLLVHGARLVQTRIENACMRPDQRPCPSPSVDIITRVQFPDRTGLTAGLRYRFTGPVRPVTGRNRSNVNLNSNFTVVAVPTGIPAGYTGIPAGLAGIPAGFVLRLTAVYRPVTPVYRPVWPVYRLFRVFFRRLKN